jgi:hypothetical protein
MNMYKLLFLLIIMTTALPIMAQDPPNRFTVGKYGFRIDLPVRPTKAEDNSFILLDFNLFGLTLVWDEGEKQLASMDIYRPYRAPRTNLTEIEKSKLIAEYKRVFLADLQTRNIMTSETPYSFQGSKGVEIRGVSSMRLVTRIFVSGNHMYVISVSNMGAAGFDSQLKVLDSFTLLTKPETIAALKWENEPNDLPQAPRGTRPISDVQGDRLKGNVQSIVDEVQESTAGPKETLEERYYDQAGDLTRNVTYNLGYPQEITRWGWINGKRVSSTNTIFYDSDDSPEGKRYVNVGPTTGLMGQQDKDSAYGAHHEFKYDDKKRITEWRGFSPDGSPRFTYKFTHSATGREMRQLDSTGGFLKRAFEVLDADGNMSEYRQLDFSGKVYSTIRYTYEFDTVGNWIVRRSFFGGGSLPKGKVQKSGPVRYRKITYYETPKA